MTGKRAKLRNPFGLFPPLLIQIHALCSPCIHRKCLLSSSYSCHTVQVRPTSHANPSLLNLLRYRMHKLLKPWQARLVSQDLAPQTTGKIENVAHGVRVQGTTKRLLPGLVNMRRKNCLLLPAAEECNFLHLIFTKPGRSLFMGPCRMGQTASRMMR